MLLLSSDINPFKPVNFAFQFIRFNPYLPSVQNSEYHMPILYLIVVSLSNQILKLNQKTTNSKYERGYKIYNKQ